MYFYYISLNTSGADAVLLNYFCSLKGAMLATRSSNTNDAVKYILIENRRFPFKALWHHLTLFGLGGEAECPSAFSEYLNNGFTDLYQTW